jgi:hypothetical protein
VLQRQRRSAFGGENNGDGSAWEYAEREVNSRWKRGWMKGLGR